MRFRLGAPRSRMGRERLRRARQQGFLDLVGTACTQRLCERQWWLECNRNSRPFVVFASGELYGEGNLSPAAREQLGARFGEDFWWHRAKFGIRNVAANVVTDVLPLLHRSGPSPELLAEGLMRCDCSDGLEFPPGLVKGEHVYVIEISNMPGHVVAFPPGRLPLVGIHLDRFEPCSKHGNNPATDC